MSEKDCDNCIHTRVSIAKEPCRTCSKDPLRRLYWEGHKITTGPLAPNANDFCDTCFFFGNPHENEGQCHLKPPAATGHRLPIVYGNIDWCRDYTPGKHRQIKESK